MSDHSSSAGPLSGKKFELLRQMLKNKGIHHASTTAAIPRRTTDEALPLSFAQQRLWFLDQLQPNSPLYNIPAVIDLDGALDHAALTEALHSLIARHEVLRTAFPARTGQPVQQIAPTLSLAVPLVDLAALPDAERAHEAERIARAEAEAPFDLACGPLLRATLLRLAPQRHRLLLTIHHTISDGWSNHVLVRDLAALYQSAVAGVAAALPALPIQYADFAIWQRNWLQGEVLERQLSYWQQQLAGAPPVLALPTDFPRPPIQRFQGGLLADRLDSALTAQLHAACRATGTTLYMVLLAAWTVLLQRWSGQHEIVVGSPVANRTQPELNELIGFFANTLVLRTDLSGNPSVRELLQRVQETTLAAQEHQDVPFEQLVERLQPVRDPSRNPLFQVMFVLQNTPAATVGSDELRFMMQEYTYTGTAKFDLWLSATERGSGLDLLLEFNADLYTKATAQRLLAQFATVVRSLLADLDQPIRAVTALPQAERRLILEQWTATAAPYPHDQCIHELVADQAARTPDAVAVVFEQHSLTYAELERRTTQLAHHLRRLGVGPDVRVGAALERSLELVVGVLGILKAGGAYVPIDPRYPAERIAYMLEDAQAPVLLTQSWLCDQLPPHAAQVVALDPEWHAWDDLPITPVHSGVTPAHPAYVTYTSGSTGRPKGCVMPHRPLVNLLQWQLNYAPLPQGSRFLQFASLSFDVSYQEIFPNLCNGNCVVMITEGLRRNLDALLDFVIEARLDAMYLPMVALQQLAEIAEYKGVVPTTLREVMVSGEQLVITPAVVRLFQHMPHCRLHNLYGPTETHAVTAYTLPDDPATWPAVVPIGRPIANSHMYVLDKDFQPTPIGVPGELYIGGDCVSDGYLNRPELTAERFMITPISGAPGARVYKTGDAARYLADGNLVFLGRLDHQVKIRGFRVELEEIEAVLNQHEAVRENTVIVREDTPGDKRLVAYVVLQRDVSTHELRLFVQAKQPDYMVPAVFVVLDRLPLTSNGKVDRKALPTPDHVRPDLTSSYVAPRTPTEQTVAAIWADVLQLEKVGVEDNFFELGGHSLNATQVVSRTREALQIDLPLYTLFQSPTVADLCQAIEHGQDVPG